MCTILFNLDIISNFQVFQNIILMLKKNQKSDRNFNIVFQMKKSHFTTYILYNMFVTKKMNVL